MKLGEKIKSLSPKLTSRKGRIVGFSLLILGSVAAATMTTLAWFNMSAKESKIKMVSGDLNVEVRKVSAYKYVYPFYKNSTEYIDYDAQGVVKKYVLEDHTLTFGNDNVDDITISSDDATVTLGEKVRRSFTTSSNDASSLNVCVPATVQPAVYSPEFRYYLIGDGLFCGVEDSWAIEKSFAFGLRENVSNDRHAILDNVVVSAGSSFTLLETLEVIENDQKSYAYNYFPISSIAETNSSFRVVDSNSDGVGDQLLCLRSGIYSFIYSPNQLKIELRTQEDGARKDVSVIMNNSLDPTKMSIDYAGSVDKDTYPTINSYVPTAIYNQNTSVILDVELNFTNPNPVDASLQIERTNSTSNSIYNIANKYEDTTHNLDGYIDEDHQNLMRASDFYNFYAQFTNTPYASTTALWNGLHRVGDNQSQKFLNDTSYDKTINCTLHAKEQGDSTTIAPSDTDNIYHCYIVIEYDYEHSTYFLDKNRLGKTYYLDRDFGFHFSGIQHRESQGMKMNKQKGLAVLYISTISLLVSTIALSVGMTISLYKKYVKGNGTYGEVSLRSYYESGSGTEDDPFIITRPRHLYNLSRLQGLGVYGEKTYFQLGKVDLGGVDSNGVPMCYADDSSNVKKPYLDMSDSDRDTNPINAIGSEALPFYGEFDGQNVEIKNLNVYANPQDAGLFGYTAHGSEVHNLFLSNVTIHALGYTSDYADLYSPESTIGNNAYFSYNPNDSSPVVNFVNGFENTEYAYFFADNDFHYTAQGSSPTPTVSIIAPSNSYTFTSLLSGDLITMNNNNQIVPNLDRIFEFFGEKKAEQDAKFPLQASSSASLIVSSVDRYGQKHSKVLLNLEFDFTLESDSANFISMGVHLAGDHGNNIGLIAGHCDGTIYDCYVYNGSFEMNNGGQGYSNLENGSNLGLIGLVGGTVQNILANESDVGAKEGKNIGVLDFTTIYKDIIDNNSFVGSHAATGGVSAGVTFTPVSTTKYMQYLRYFDGQYITKQTSSVAFKGRSIITNTDLGVFTVATDPQTGEGTYSGDHLDQSLVLTEDLTINDNYYIYYSTGEYNKAYHTRHGGSSFDNYIASYNTNNAASSESHILQGHHFPRKDEVTRESFETREARQNYFVRFQLDPNYRKGKGFYFSDLDTDTDSGAFMANYFNYKLVDQNGYHIPINTNKCGVMLKTNLRQEVSNLSASFGLPDLTKTMGNDYTRSYCLQDAEGNRYVGNMINFEIKNDLANVTVIAAPSDHSKPAALGVYKLDNSDFSGVYDDTYTLEFTQKYNNPDYAFFMPDDNHLTYFDYRVNGTTNKGEIGTYSNAGTFTVANNASNATVAKEHGITEHNYISGKTRLFAHTFCLPRGRYCIGSASSGSQCVPKVYYLCAQGQDDGQFDFDDTVFSSTDRVENVDFINTSRFADNGTENILVQDITTYNPSSQTDGNKLGNRRCYIALVNSDRSIFSGSIPSDLSFEYDPVSGKFIISSTLQGQDLIDAITRIAVDNYNHPYAGDPKQLTVSLLGIESSGQVIVYPAGDQEVIMKISKFLKCIGFFIAIIPFSGVSCKQNVVLNETSLPNYTHTPKYLLAGELDSIDGDFVYYSINNDTEYAVALKENSKSLTSELTILSEYNNKPVTGIWRSGFYESNSTKINIPSSITVIDYEAFLGSKITSVSIPATVTDIGEGAFYSCKSLTKATIQNSTASSTSSACSCSEVIDNGNGQGVTHSTLKTIPSFCFFNCVALKELVLPESIEEIEYEAFNGCHSLYSTLAFMNLKTIRSRAFQNCISLRQIYISSTAFFDEDEHGEPAGIIEDKAFNGCDSSLYFHLSGDNDDINTWLNLSRNKYHWNRRSEFENPQSNDNLFGYEITAGGASYSNDWIYTTDISGNVHITSYIGPTEIEGEPVEFLSFPNELPSGTGNYVRSFATDALVTVRANLKRIYLPTTLKRIDNSQFDGNYTNLIVVDDNTKCSADQTLVDREEELEARITLNGLTNLEVIGTRAFLDMPKLNTVTKLYLPYSLKAVGSRAFGSSESNKKHLSKVTDFRWYYDDDNSALEVIGREAFYKMGKNDESTSLSNTIHQGYIANTEGDHKYELTTLVIPRTFKHFGVTGTDKNTYVLSESDGNDALSAFAVCPLLSTVVFKGSKKSVLQGNNPSDNTMSHLVISQQTFAVNESLRTIVIEERAGKCVGLFTHNGENKPCIGWSSGYSKNDFGGDPGIQTIVLPNKYTTLVVQNHALRGNSRSAIYLSGSDSGSKIKGSSQTDLSKFITNPATSAYNLPDNRVEEWHAIGYENSIGYYFNPDWKNTFGLKQEAPIYTNVLYKDTIDTSGCSGLEVEVGTGNTREYVESEKCSFVTGIVSGKATMTNYLYDRYSSTFNGTAKVPGVVTNSAGTDFSVNAIGDSAFSACFCDSTSYSGIANHPDLSAISLPHTIETIGNYAFMRAYGVTKISSHNATSGATNGDYVMPSSLTSIGKHAFAFCNVQKVLNIPLTCMLYENEHATTTETCAFSNNFSLRQITFGNGATSSTYYETTTYTASGGGTYTSAIYSKDNVTENASSLLMVLNRNAADSYAASDDLEDRPENNIHHGRFDGQYADHFLYGAFKMCYWLDWLVIGIAPSAIDQPLISGIVNSYIYLGNEIQNYINNTCNLTTISFGDCVLSNVPPYAFSGCEKLAKIELPYREGATIPEGLFSFVTNPNIQFVVPYVENGEPTTKTCPVGELDLTYTGYVGVDANAFKNTGIKKIIAPITTTFTLESDSFAGTSLDEVDFRNVTSRVVLNGAFRGATIKESATFKYNNTAKIEFGAETFKNAKFTDNTFVFPAKTAIIGTSCFENCSTLYNVSAAASLTELELVGSDNASGLNNDGSDELATTFKQIGDYAFYMCTNLSNFDFTNFNTITRIGHYAFSMNNAMSGTNINTEASITNKTATIVSNKKLDLPASITNLGVGAFYGCGITEVTINSTGIKFERGRNYTQSSRAKLSNGGFQFRSCAELTKVYFTHSDCAWNSLYLVKKVGNDRNNDQANYFSSCGKLDYLYLPTGFQLQYFDNVNPDDETKRPDSMIWSSKNTIKVYLYHTLNDVDPNYHHGVCIYWHRTTTQLYDNLVYFVGNNLDVAQNVNGTYSLKPTATGGTRFWARIGNNDVFLGTATGVDSNGIVTFSEGYKANGSSVYAAS